ncbi:MarR family transcriptional regulator [Paenibacillus sp. TCA20]|nr:MarR family transcriptional regulator [Paenibacillus sp. TCA20]
MTTYPFIKEENDYSERVALEGFSDIETENMLHSLRRIRSNIEKDWEYVKRGKKRVY